MLGDGVAVDLSRARTPKQAAAAAGAAMEDAGTKVLVGTQEPRLPKSESRRLLRWLVPSRLDLSLPTLPELKPRKKRSDARSEEERAARLADLREAGRTARATADYNETHADAPEKHEAREPIIGAFVRAHSGRRIGTMPGAPAADIVRLAAEIPGCDITGYEKDLRKASQAMLNSQVGTCIVVDDLCEHIRDHGFDGEFDAFWFDFTGDLRREKTNALIAFTSGGQFVAAGSEFLLSLTFCSAHHAKDWVECAREETFHAFGIDPGPVNHLRETAHILCILHERGLVASVESDDAGKSMDIEYVGVRRPMHTLTLRVLVPDDFVPIPLRDHGAPDRCTRVGRTALPQSNTTIPPRFSDGTAFRCKATDKYLAKHGALPALLPEPVPVGTDVERRPAGSSWDDLAAAGIPGFASLEHAVSALSGRVLVDA